MKFQAYLVLSKKTSFTGLWIKMKENGFFHFKLFKYKSHGNIFQKKQKLFT